MSTRWSDLVGDDSPAEFTEETTISLPMSSRLREIPGLWPELVRELCTAEDDNVKDLPATYL